MTYGIYRRVGWWLYIAQKSRNSIAVVRVMRMGGGKKGMIDYLHTHKHVK